MDTLRTRLRAILGETTAHHWPNTTLNLFLNEAVRQVALDCPVCYAAEWIGSSTSGTRDYTLPSDFMPPVWSVIYNNGRSDEKELRFLPQDRAASYHGAGNSEPNNFTYMHKDGVLVLRFMPTPNTTIATNLRVHCGRFPSDMTSDSDSMPLNIIFQDPVMSFAKMRCWEEWEQWDYAGASRMEYEQRMMKARRLWGEPINAYPIPLDSPNPALPPSERPGDWGY